MKLRCMSNVTKLQCTAMCLFGSFFFVDFVVFLLIRSSEAYTVPLFV